VKRYESRLFPKELGGFHVVRMGMGAYDQADVVKRQPQFHKPLVNMVKQGAVAGVDKYTGRSVY